MKSETVVPLGISDSHSVVAQTMQAARGALEDALQRHALLDLIVAALIAFAIVLVAKNTILSPLRAIPGPWLAGLTSWYEFYYDVIKNGTYAHQHSKMHQQYASTVIRISPNHVHIISSPVITSLFAIGPSGSRFRKAKYYYNSIGMSTAIGSHYDVESHHRHRSTMAVGFSSKSITAFNTTIVEYAREAMDVIASRGLDGTPVVLSHHTQAYTIDVVSKISFGQPVGAMKEDGVYPPTVWAMDNFSNHFNFTKHFPYWQLVLPLLPPTVVKRLMPGVQYMQELGTRLITDLIAKRQIEGRSDEEYQEGEGAIFETLLKPNPKKQYPAPGLNGLVEDACAFLVGGSDTTGLTLQAVTLFVLRNPAVYSKLRSELDSAAEFIRDDFDMHTVSKLTWLTAVIRETMRLLPPTPGPLPREVPPEGIRVGKYFLPGGTIVSSGLLSLHYNPSLFPEPDKFKPERWLGEDGARLVEWWNPFSRGPRSCLGRQVAWHELVTFLAHLFLRFDLELFQSDETNLEWTEHMFTRIRAPIKIKVLKDRWA
ncbi:cytochrome P450 [Aspergillus heterothallicus]